VATSKRAQCMGQVRIEPSGVAGTHPGNSDLGTRPSFPNHNPLDRSSHVRRHSPYRPEGLIKVTVEAGKTYHWCACRNSKNQRMCDGSHKGNTFTAMNYTADVMHDKWFCACKHSGTKPMCDGSHKKL